jgi:hypothetical protein
MKTLVEARVTVIAKARGCFADNGQENREVVLSGRLLEANRFEIMVKENDCSNRW